MKRIAAASTFFAAIGLASSSSSDAATCSFVTKTQVCVGPGQNCCANNGQYLVSAPPVDGVYSPAFCKVTFGDGLHACGLGSAGPTFDQVYGSPCTGRADDLSCQFADPTLMGEEKYPSELQCVVSNDAGTSYSCLLNGIQRTGDPCTASVECASKSCVAGVCQGLPQVAACTTGGCGAGLYCHTSTTDTGHCAPITGPGGACSHLEGCAAGFLCNLADATMPSCLQLFSVANGIKVNSPDLCATGFTDSNKACSDPVPVSSIGSNCDCATPSPVSGGVCECAKDNYCRLAPYNQRTAAMVAARKAARQCFISKFAPDGTPCQDAFANIGLGKIRNSEVLGTCGWYACHGEIMSYAAAQSEVFSSNTYLQFNHEQNCASAAKLSYTTAAANGQIGCYLPNSLKALGWSCSTDKPAGLSGGAKFGIAMGIMLPLAAIGFVVYSLKTGKGPRFIHTGAEAVSSGWSKLVSSGRGGYASLSKTSATSSSSNGSGGASGTSIDSRAAYASIGSPSPLKATSYQ